MRKNVQALSKKIAGDWTSEMTEAARDAGRAQALAFGDAAAGSFEEKLKASRTALEQAAGNARRAVKSLTWKWIALEMGLAAGVAVGVAWLAWGWVPSLEEIRQRRVQVETLNIQAQRLADTLAAVDLRQCEVGNPRQCVRVDLRAARFGPNGDYFVVAKGSP